MVPDHWSCALITGTELTMKDNNRCQSGNTSVFDKENMALQGLKIEHFCYFQNTLPFVFTTDDIDEKCPKNVMR